MHVRRQRRRGTGSDPGLLRRPAGNRIRLRILAASAVALAIAGGGMASASTEQFGNAKVGETTPLGLMLPDDQAIAPVGDRLLVNNGKLLASTVSPDGHYLAALTNDRAIALTIVDLQTYKVIQQAGTDPNADLHLNANNVGQQGPTYSPTARRCGCRRSTATTASLSTPTAPSKHRRSSRFPSTGSGTHCPPRRRSPQTVPPSTRPSTARTASWR